MTIYVFYALKQEAASFLFDSKFQFKKIRSHVYHLQDQAFTLNVIISGLCNRKIKNKMSLLSEIDASALVIKAGTCALLDSNLSLLTPYVPDFVTEDTERIKVSAPSFFAPYQNGRGLITVKKPVTTDQKHSQWINEGIYFADMESYFIMQTFNSHQYKFPLLVGTDLGNQHTYKDFVKNVKSASAVLRDTLTRFIDEL